MLGRDFSISGISFCASVSPCEQFVHQHSLLAMWGFLQPSEVQPGKDRGCSEGFPLKIKKELFGPRCCAEQTCLASHLTPGNLLDSWENYLSAFLLLFLPIKQLFHSVLWCTGNFPSINLLIERCLLASSIRFPYSAGGLFTVLISCLS